MAVIVFIILGLIVIIVTLGSYLWVGGFASTLSSDSANWADFGTYLGGTAGPLLSFLALVAVAWTLRLQSGLFKRDRQRQLAEQLIRTLDTTYTDIKDVLEASVGQRTLKALLAEEGEVSAQDQQIFQRRLIELMKLLAPYCEAVALYRDNITEYFDVKIFADRGARLLDQIKPFHQLLGNMAPITIEFCDMHIRGERSRKHSESLMRPTRR